MSRDYFDVLGLDRSYGLDELSLESAYLKRQQETHPDRFRTASQNVQAEMHMACQLVNQAYTVLRDPFLRAQYLLGMTDDAARGLCPDQVLVGEMFDLQQELCDQNTRNVGYQRLESDKQRTETALAQAFSDNRLDDALKLWQRWAYLRRMRADSLDTL